MKTCNRCFVSKDETEFYRNCGMPDGLLKQCKACVDESHAAYNNTPAGKETKARERRKHAAKYREWKRAYKKTPKGRAAAKRYVRPADRSQAKDAVNNAIKAGLLVPLPCELCGSKAEAHHCSYSPEMRLAVTWLCRDHHNQLHREFSQVKFPHQGSRR